MTFGGFVHLYDNTATKCLIFIGTYGPDVNTVKVNCMFCVAGVESPWVKD